MAKTKLNNNRRYEIKKIINQYIRNEFEKDKRFTDFKEKISYFVDLTQKEYDKVVNMTQDVKDFLQLAGMYGSVDAYTKYFSYYQLNMDIQGCYGYNCLFDLAKLGEKYSYLKDYYKTSSNSSGIAHAYLESLEEFNDWIKNFEDLNEEYEKLYSKMCVIVDNCKYMEDIKEILPINEVIKYVNETLYNCNTFISVVTDADVSLVQDFINKSKNNA